MIRVNLLPHRANRRAAQKRQLIAMGVLTAIIGGAIVGFVWVVLDQKIEYQNGRNKYLESEIAVLDKQIEQIKKLKDEIQALLTRKQVVETLQSNRGETVHVLDTLVHVLPDGVYLKAVRQTGKKLAIDGYAQSNARVSTLIRNLNDASWLGQPALVEIKSETVNNQKLAAFSMTASIIPPKSEANPEAQGKTADAGAAGAPSQAAKTKP